MHRGYQEQLLREKQPAPKRRWKKKKVLFFAILATLIFAGLIFLIRAPFLQVSTIQVEGIHAADPGDVQFFLETKLSGNRWVVIPKSSIFFLGKKKLIEGLQKEFPRFSAMNIQRINFHTILVSVQEYEEWVLWCQKQGTQNEHCYFMDALGVVFGPAPFFSGTAYVKVYKSLPDGELPFQALELEELALLKRYLTDLPNVRMVPTSVSFDSQYKMTIRFLYGNGTAELLVNPNHSPDMVLENLSAALAADPFKSEFRSGARQLDYIDARFTNKVVYRFHE